MSCCVAIVPKTKILQRYYRCDKRFHTDILSLTEKVRSLFGLVWCTGDDVDLYEFYDNFETKKVESCTAHLKNSHKKGGQSQKRFERLIDNQREDYFGHIADVMETTWSQNELIQRVFIVGNSVRTKELWKRLSRTLQLNAEIVVSDGTPIMDVIKSLDLNVNVKTDKCLCEFYSSLHKNMATYGQQETFDLLQQGQLRVMISPTETDALIAQRYGTDFVHLQNKTALEHRFRREFGGYGGITRWKTE